MVEGTAVESGAGKRRLMVMRAFLAQNVAIGCAFGGFGVSVLPLQEKFGASRGTTALAISLCVLVLGLVGPLVATLIGRIGLRWTMVIGTLLSGAGYALLAVAPNMTVVLVAYALPIGIGLAMFGPFPASVLASNWFPHNPGLALGVANMPLLVAAMPMAGLAAITAYGLSGFYLALAVLHILLVPFLLGVTDGPAGRPAVAGAHGPSGDAGAKAMVSTATLLRRPAFWAMCVGGGFLNATGITGVSHLVAFAAERGVATEQAAGLLSIVGGAAVIGSLFVGFLCGKLGSARTLALLATALGGAWLVMLGTTTFAVLAVAALFMGAAGAGVFPAINMLSGRLFGIASLPRVVGLFGLVTLPLTFCIPPLAGVVRDILNGYDPVVGFLIAGCAAVAVLFVTMGRGAAHAVGLTEAPAV